MLRNVYVANALVEMYAKCGSIRRAWKVFRGMGTRRDLCSWNSMIMAFAVHGLWTEALALFHKLRMTGAKPDGITFVGVILACTHGGLVDEGKLLFNSMRGEFGQVSVELQLLREKWGLLLAGLIFQHKEKAWFSSSVKSRLQYFGPQPGIPVLDDEHVMMSMLRAFISIL
ncbi:hypothetical protein ZEAMMB73_Zm00001d030070 [Zea mays]|uniref:Pentatricopeptide repeat-containing protein n=1 Tax=Zea mays TaxID=4577 RepID=A0A1D6K9G1_MAIZE|nr:hypothetical protein ZEAMMB73_Zm00001d030070 [Zea mays]